LPGAGGGVLRCSLTGSTVSGDPAHGRNHVPRTKVQIREAESGGRSPTVSQAPSRTRLGSLTSRRKTHGKAGVVF
jgi:hypothetical protein